MRQQDERDLRTLLRDEAERHRPDRDAMRDRVDEGRAEESRPAFFVRLRPVAAALAVAGVLVGVVGIRLADGEPEPDGNPVSAATTPAPTEPAPTDSAPTDSAPTDSAPTDPAPTDPAPTDPASSAPTAKASASSGSTTKDTPGRTSGFLTSSAKLDPNSNDNWSQTSVRLETTKTITALDLAVTVALTAGVAETGKWSTIPNNLLTTSVTRGSGKLVYRFTLNPGATLTPGSYVFAAQFNHQQGARPLSGDSYAATASAGRKEVKVSGGFTAK
jgi:hypothetical protein